MRDSLKVLVGAVTVSGMLFAGAPAASADTASAVQGCTTDFADQVLRPPNPQTPVITTNPPTVSVGPFFVWVSGYTTATKAFLDCVV